MNKLVQITAIVCVMAGAAVAKPNLRDVDAIDDALLAVGLADEIRKTCSEISPRYLKALRFVNGLRDKARDMGYSDAEIDAYRKSPTEKARLRKEGKAYLAANGVVPDQPETYCALGRAEIEKSSLIGSLLRVN
ncbi:hypothetical protein ASD8599_02481 [Ascidiaceihabitans donghaensis]|uniref:DUF5333 domain-containing protein n=1 Tax=Ascidiaceihabitans donghaensis TaxID=1510460 RepID=A0A2R8BF73_9RHOB|nr:DUF5333 domain-containing protein [Ascidiaceihabitans donghaensis]SPH21730.1 hypothetical protein ASD8599_02481 [Ascidiaceihabitans donghaensis]